MIGANIGKFLNDVAHSGGEQRRRQTSWIFPTSPPRRASVSFWNSRKDADVDNLINMLYKKTRLEDTFGVNMLAVADGKPGDSEP